MPQTFADPTAFRADYDRLVAFETGDKVRRSTLPPSPNDYKAELPADFKVPDGMKYEFKPDDPLLYQARQLFHDIDQGKISGQDAFSKARKASTVEKALSANVRNSESFGSLSAIG